MKTFVLTATLLSAFAFAGTAAATPILCMGSDCPGAGLLMCVDGDVNNVPECAEVPPMNCIQIYYELDLGAVVVGYGPCTNVDVTVLGHPVLS